MSRLRLAVWSPLPPSPSGIADYVAEQLPELARHLDLTVVVPDPAAVSPVPGAVRLCAAGDPPEADLHLYHLGNSPAHVYVYRAALQRPGVVVLHDYSLHHLVLFDTVERGDRHAYLREMRRAHGQEGTVAGRQVACGLGGDLLPALYPLNDRVLDGCLALVALTESTASRARLRLAGRPALHLRHHLSLPLDPMPGREEARAALGLPRDVPIVTAPGLATLNKRLDVVIRAVGRLRETHPGLRLVVAGGVDPRVPLSAWAAEAGLGEALVVTGRLDLAGFARHLAAADVVLALRFPSHGEISGAQVRALGVGRPVLVTGGTPGETEFPPGVVVPVDPGPAESEHLLALLDRLLGDRGLRETIGGLARRHMRAHHSLPDTVARLVEFLHEVVGRRAELQAEVALRRSPEGTLLAYLLDEVRWGTLELGLAGVPLGVEPLLADLAGQEGRWETSAR